MRSFRLRATDLLQVSNFFTGIARGLDGAAFIRTVSVRSTTSVTAEQFRWKSACGVHVVNLDSFGFSLVPCGRYSGFLYRRLCTSRNFDRLCEFQVVLLEKVLLQGTGGTFLDDLVTCSLRLVRYVSIDSSVFCARDLNM